MLPGLSLPSCVSSGRLCRSSKPVVAPTTRHFMLELSHSLLVLGRVPGLLNKLPLQELVGIVGLETGLENAEPFAVSRDFLPIALDILEVLREIGVGTLEDLPIDDIGHLWLDADVRRVGLLRLAEDVLRRLLDCSHETPNFLGVLGNESIVCYWLSTYVLVQSVRCIIYLCIESSRSNSIQAQPVHRS